MTQQLSNYIRLTIGRGNRKCVRFVSFTPIAGVNYKMTQEMVNGKLANVFQHVEEIVIEHHVKKRGKRNPTLRGAPLKGQLEKLAKVLVAGEVITLASVQTILGVKKTTATAIMGKFRKRYGKNAMVKVTSYAVNSTVKEKIETLGAVYEDYNKHRDTGRLTNDLKNVEEVFKP